MRSRPTTEDVRVAARRIAGIARVTPLLRSSRLSEHAGTDVWLKLESEQETGSFKVRGAANTLLQLDETETAAGVVAVSSGNHGRAVAHVARSLGIAATICLSSRVPRNKVLAIEELGARVVVAGPGQEEAEVEARRLVEADGLTFVHPFDDPRVIAGQGTVGLEILDQLPEVATIVVPLSGGGLAAGVALAVADRMPRPLVVGVSQDRGPAMVESISAGHLVEVVEEDTLADALAGGLGPVNHHSFALCRALLAGTAVVSEDAIADAMAALNVHEGLTVEGGGAVGVAAVASGTISATGPIVVIISGGNVAPETMDRVLTGRG